MIDWVDNLMKDYVADSAVIRNPYSNVSVSYKIMREGAGAAIGSGFGSNVLLPDRYKIRRDFVKLSKVLQELSTDELTVLHAQYLRQSYLFTSYKRATYFVKLDKIHSKIAKMMKKIKL